MKLEVRRKKIGLTKSEERKYCKLNSELTGYPEKVFTKDFEQKLNSAISITDKLLVLLKDEKKNRKEINRIINKAQRLRQQNKK